MCHIVGAAFWTTSRLELIGYGLIVFGGLLLLFILGGVGIFNKFMAMPGRVKLAIFAIVVIAFAAFPATSASRDYLKSNCPGTETNDLIHF